MLRHDFRAEILDEVAHRPWPLPKRRWTMTQTWHDLLFAHWPIEPSRLRARIPGSLELDLFNGTAWLGIVPFGMRNVAPRGVPPIPGVSDFPELNVRTYVRVGDRPGVFFFSLDAASAVAVRVARWLFNLPYHVADMSLQVGQNGVRYRCSRASNANAAFLATYQGAGPASPARPGSLDYFLTERYCLYHVNRRGLPYRLDIHHPPWLLQSAKALIERNTMAEASGLVLGSDEPLLHFAERQDVVTWMPVDVNEGV